MNMYLDAESSRYRIRPEIVRLPVRAGQVPSEKPPVRIFLGTEDGQWRAERVFVYSVERVRDPSRAYEIHLMKNLSGFDRTGWRTGFTNYRYAIPELAGGCGRAIYNDVDQIYLCDPAELFDLPLEERGYLSVSPEDTSVMLLDCARMLPVWNLRQARSRTKSELLRAPNAEAIPWGPLDGRWNARDTEYPRSEVRCLHFTALHLQPWRPFPEDYSYHEHPLSELWFDLEADADRDGYQVFTAQRPSSVFDSGRSNQTGGLRGHRDVRAWLADLSCRVGSASLLCVVPVDSQSDVPPDLLTGAGRSGVSFDELRTAGLLADRVAAWGIEECVPAEDIPWLLERLFASARERVELAVCCVERVDESAVDVRRSHRTADWWQAQVLRVAEHFPAHQWQLVLSMGSATRVLRSRECSRPPSVWLLEGHRMGDVMQLRRLATRLGWPTTSKRLQFNAWHLLPGFLQGASVRSLSDRGALNPPWPDLVIASGKRSSPVARWIRKRSGGRTRLVHLGRPWSRMDAFDLIVTSPQYRLPARENTIHLTLPITARDAEDEAPTAADLERYRNLPSPRIALLVGGGSTSCRLTPALAAELARRVNRLALDLGGSLLVSTSPRTSGAIYEAIRREMTAPGLLYRFGDGGENPYRDFLAIADRIVVTQDSASMLADALASGKLTDVFPVAPTLLARLLHTLRLPIDLWTNRRKSYRGTPAQQGRLARFLDRLVVAGVYTPARDMNFLTELLIQRELVGAEELRADRSRVGEKELERVVQRIRSLVMTEEALL